MEQRTLLKIAQFRTLAARKGKVFDVARFASDRQFAAQTLSQVLADADEELMLAGLSLMDLLGMTQGASSRPPSASRAAPGASTPSPGPAPRPASTPSSAPAPSPAAAAPEPPRYVGRLR